jgi:glycosyltransferase involved in cell wall biosynthesis
MEKSKLISVIIPTHNRGQLIERAICSVLQQTYKDLELIIVDDGSTDNTREVVEKYTDDRIRYIACPRRGGAAAARNRGIAEARGEYIAFLDSDDEWLSNKLEEEIRVLEGLPEEYGVVYSGGWVYQKNRERKYIPYATQGARSGDLKEIILRTGLICPPGAIVKKKCFDRVGLFDESMPAIEDWEFWIRVSKSYYFHYLQKPLWNYYLKASGSLSSNEGALLKALNYIYKKHYDEISRFRYIEAKYLFWIGNLLIKNGQIREGRRYLVKSFILRPTALENMSCWAISFFGQRIYASIDGIKQRIKSRLR